ncbi:MAG: immunoglobulin domain-containing protein [Verrucomicrobiota bacterium]
MKHSLFGWLGLMVFAAFGPAVFAQTPVWSQFTSSPTGTSPRNDDIHFVDPLHGWAARATDGIYRTTNGGVTFTRVRPANSPYPGTNLTAHFRSINFASPLRGWAGNLGPGSYDGSVTDTNLLFETFDGGVTWSPVAAINNSDMKGFCSIHVLDAQHIYGGGRVRGPAHFAYSTDGGTNWSVTNLTTAGIMGGIMDVYFKDPQVGFIVGMDTNLYAAPPYYGSIARTTNGGLTWQVLVTTPVASSYFWKMSWPSPNIGYVTLQQNAGHDTVVYYKTTDGGASWVSNGIPIASIGGPSFGLQGIGFVSETEGWMGGSSSVAAPYNFIHTTNGGATWTAEGYENTQQINRIRFLNSSFGYASGRRLHVFRVPLAIVTPPTNQTVAFGGSAMFHVAAQGFAPLTYQWRFNGTNVAGANTNTYLIASVQTTNAGDYSVVVSDYSGSLTSAVATLSVTGVPAPPTIISQPQSVDTIIGSNVAFSVIVTGTPPMNFRWQRSGTNFPGLFFTGAFESSVTIINAQLANAGDYTVIVSNAVGVVTSAVATLTFNQLFRDNFDGYAAPNIVTNVGTTNGYKVFFRAAASVLDFKAIFGFDYSTVTYPTNIPPAPHSSGGTTKGLYLTVNKDTTPAAAAVNLYPVGQSFSNNFALKFDLWINWRDIDTSTEHALFGINHSGDVTNRVGQSPSDGLFFAVEGEDDSLPTSTTLRDYSVFRGNGSGAPILMTTNNTTFGPAPLLAPQFENYNAGFVALFPPKTIPGFGTTPAGTAGLGWVRGEVRQVNDRITWLLNDTIIAQYTNLYAYTNGNILIGYNDNFNSTGDSNNFVVFDNIRVETVVVAPVRLLTPELVGSDFRFSFATEPYESYTVQSATNLTTPIWNNYTNLMGDGLTNPVSVPLLPGGSSQQYFRVRRP